MAQWVLSDGNMKNRWVILAAAGMALAGAWTAGGAPEKADARGEFARGEEAYAKGAFAEAAEAFLSAADGAAGEGLDADAARFNALVAAEAAGEEGKESADRVLNSVETTSDIGLQAQLHFNRGNAWRKRADEAREAAGEGSGAGFQEAKEAWEEYCKAVLLDPTRKEFRENCEMGQALMEKITQEIKEQKDQLKEGDDDKKIGEEEGDDEGYRKDPEGDTGMEDPEGDKQMPKEDGDSQSDDSQSEGREGEEGGEEEQEAQPQPRGEEMTEEEAARLMDAMKEREEGQRDGLRVILGRPVPVEKDW